MTESRRPITDQELVELVDNQLGEAAASDLRTRLQQDPAARKRLSQYEQLNDDLRRGFETPVCDAAAIERMLDAPRLAAPVDATSSLSTSQRRWLIVAAASTAAMLATWWSWTGANRRPDWQPHFVARPLTDVYRECVDQGFRPYYFCEDDERFAMTFRERQQVSLELTELPSDRAMIGLSYLGGLARTTTAMLAVCADQPVVVFVERSDRVDLDKLETGESEGLYVHSVLRDGLVFFEVSPLRAPKFLAYLRRVEGATR